MQEDIASLLRQPFGSLPELVALQASQRPAEQLCHHAANGDAHGIDADGIRPALGGVIVCDDRVGGRRASGFTDGDAHPEEEQPDEAGGKAAEHGHERPDDDAERDDHDAVRPVGPHRNRNAHDGVE